MIHVPDTGPAKRGRGLEIAAGLCLLVSLATMAQSISRDLGVLGWFAGLGFGMAFLSIPFVIGYLFGRTLRSPLLRKIVMALMAAALGWWLYLWYTIFIVAANPDAQDGLVIVVAPVYSGAAMFVVCGLLKFLDQRV